eukprot:1156748-Pelagomonas_calceolata.AAC.3
MQVWAMKHDPNTARPRKGRSSTWLVRWTRHNDGTTARDEWARDVPLRHVPFRSLGHKYSLNTTQPEATKSQAQLPAPQPGKQRQKAEGNVQDAGTAPSRSSSGCMHSPCSRGGQGLQGEGAEDPGPSGGGGSNKSKQQTNGEGYLKHVADGEARQQGDKSKQKKKRRVSNGAAQQDPVDAPAWRPGDGSILRLFSRE